MTNLFIVRLQPHPQPALVALDKKQEYQQQHHHYIDNLVDQQTILFGGPIIGKPGGMLIVQADSLEEVQTTFNADPLVANQILQCTVNQWEIKHGSLSLDTAS